MSNSVKKGFEIIKYIADRQGQLTLSDISRQLGINKTTAFRYLETMEELNILEKSDNTWKLGIGLFELGSKVDFPASMVSRIRPVIADLSRRLNETVNFAGLFGDKAVYLDKIKSNRSLQMRSKIGEELPLYCTGLGKIILSGLEDKQFIRIIKNIVYTPMTEKTIKDRESLIQEIEVVRKQKYALDDEEYEHGLTCIAVSLEFKNIDFKSAISISGTSARYTDEMIVFFVSELNKAKQQIKDLEI